MKPRILIGSHNLHKVEEIAAVLPPYWEVMSMKDMGDIPVPEETGDTLEANARLKAEYYHHKTGLQVIADDTGLEVEALHGAPGVYSSSYGGEEGNAKRNIERLLTALKGIRNRRACFRTVIAWHDGHVIRTFDGYVEGNIAEIPSGTAGFGYDPVFIPEGSPFTFAEMTPEQKAMVSHRSHAVRRFREAIATLYS